MPLQNLHLALGLMVIVNVCGCFDDTMYRNNHKLLNNSLCSIMYSGIGCVDVNPSMI
jgi:hypothetical protein